MTLEPVEPPPAPPAPPCNDCGAPSVFEFDPYESEINDRLVPAPLFKTCHDERARAI